MSNPIMVLGIGNVLMGDEGVGPAIVEALEKEELPEQVTLMDGGTGGFHLMGYIEGYDPIIMIDATMDKQPAGTIRLIEPRFASDFPKSLSAHDIGLKDMIESAALIDFLPKVYLIVVSVDEVQNMVMEISEEVQPAIAKSVDMVKDIIKQLT